MQLNYDRLSKLSRDIVLYTPRKTSNIPDGNFTSINRGKSLDFDDLREYAPGDDFHDIDWKSSSRTDKILIRRYIAEKKHKILFIADGGPKMDADTSAGKNKAELMLLTFGTIAYLAGRQGADFSLMYGSESGIKRSHFSSDNVHLERLMREYGDNIIKDTPFTLDKLLADMYKNPCKRAVIFILTDMDGLSAISEQTLLFLSAYNEVLIICVDDAFLTGQNVFDTENGAYADRFFSRSKKLRAAEAKKRNELLGNMSLIAKRSRVCFTPIQSEAQLMDTVVNLFERLRNGIYG